VLVVGIPWTYFLIRASCMLNKFMPSDFRVQSFRHIFSAAEQSSVSLSGSWYWSPIICCRRSPRALGAKFWRWRRPPVLLVRKRRAVLPVRKRRAVLLVRKRRAVLPVRKRRPREKHCFSSWDQRTIFCCNLFVAQTHQDTWYSRARYAPVTTVVCVFYAWLIRRRWRKHRHAWLVFCFGSFVYMLRDVTVPLFAHSY